MLVHADAYLGKIVVCQFTAKKLKENCCQQWSDGSN